MSDTLFQYLREKINIAEKDIEALTPFITTLDVQKGAMILQPGEVCKDLYFVSSGCLRSYFIDNKNKEYIVQFAPERWWISDLNSFLKEEPATYYIDAVENSQVVLLPREQYMHLDTLCPPVYTLFQNLLQNNNLAIQRRLISSLSASAEERYHEFMSTHANLALRLPQHMIASYLGIAPESLSRVRKKVSTKTQRSV